MKSIQDKAIPLSLALMILVVCTSPISLPQLIKPAAAAPLTSVFMVPTNNIVNTRTTYDIFFKTTTTGTIKTIHMNFPSGFDVSAATKLIEREGIGSGSLSVGNPTSLIYTVTNPVSVPAGTTIRLEIGRIVNANTAGNFKVWITTENPTPTTIDGPTYSFLFPIKDITGDDVSPNFMIRKTLKDDTSGHAQGWNPDGGKTDFVITDSDAGVSSATSDSVFISLMTRNNFQGVCMVADTQDTFFEVRCSGGPNDGSELHYEIHKLPGNVVASSVSSTSSAQYESTRAHDQIASEFP